MLLSIIPQSDEVDADLLAYAERRMRFALSRFSPRIERVTVVLHDINGPRGGVDKSCRIAVKMRRQAEIVVTTKDVTWEVSLARGAERVGRAVGRAVERKHAWDRRRPHLA